MIQQLARNDEIAVAGPVLTQSARLTIDDLVEIAEAGSQQHLLAISGRSQLEEAVTDVLIERGDQEIMHRLANAGARFSGTSFTALVRDPETSRPGRETRFAARSALRMLRDLLLRATEAVRARLLALAPPETQAEIQRVLAKIANEVGREATASVITAQAGILLMKKEGRLNKAALLEFADRQLYEQMVAALSMMSSASIDVIALLMKGARSNGLLVPCKAAGLKWPTVSAILCNRYRPPHPVSDANIAFAKEDFLHT